VVCVPLCVRVFRVSRVCPGSPRCLFTGKKTPGDTGKSPRGQCSDKSESWWWRFIGLRRMRTCILQSRTFGRTPRYKRESDFRVRL